MSESQSGSPRPKKRSGSGWAIAAAAVLLIGAGAYVTYLWLNAGDSSGSSSEVAVAPSEVVVVPDVSGLPEDDARAQLEDLGLEVGTIEILDTADDMPVGSVIAQMPAAGTEWIKGQPVAFATAGGPDDGTGTVVPSVLDSSYELAVKELAEAGLLAVGITDDPSQLDRPDVDVVEQLPAEGQKVPQGSTVLLRLGQ